MDPIAPKRETILPTICHAFAPPMKHSGLADAHPATRTGRRRPPAGATSPERTASRPSPQPTHPPPSPNLRSPAAYALRPPRPRTGNLSPIIHLAGHMRLILPNPRGFCAGVRMAIDVVDQVLDLFPGQTIYVFHEIVHNKHVVGRFRDRGVVFVDSIAEVP